MISTLAWLSCRKMTYWLKVCNYFPLGSGSLQGGGCSPGNCIPLLGRRRGTLQAEPTLSSTQFGPKSIPSLVQLQKISIYFFSIWCKYGQFRGWKCQKLVQNWRYSTKILITFTLKNKFCAKQTLSSTLLPLKNHTLSSTSLQTLTLSSIKSGQNRTFAVLACAYTSQWECPSGVAWTISVKVGIAGANWCTLYTNLFA